MDKASAINESAINIKVLQNLQKISAKAPEAAIVLGSGVDVLNDLSYKRSFSYKEVFETAPSVKGHSGILELGLLEGKLIAVLRGRFHLYEGHDFATVTLPTRSLAAWGVPELYLTNAAGAINANFSVGNLMLVTGYRDHLNPKWIELGGLPALRAATVNCQNKLTENIWQNWHGLNLPNNSGTLQCGVYVGVLGPCYETLAEIKMFAHLGADAVGMSTVPELIAAAETNMQVAAVSVITNSWSEDKIHGHQEVVQAAQAASERLENLLRQVILAN